MSKNFNFHLFTNQLLTNTEQANLTYRLSSVDKMLEEETLMKLIEHYENFQIPRLHFLNSYYLNENVSIANKRRREAHLSDHRISHPFARYIADFNKTYMLGVPVKMTYNSTSATEDENNDIEEIIKDINRENNTDSENARLGLDLAIFGRAYERVYRSQEDVTRFKRINPMSVFCVYSNDIEEKMIGAVVIYEGNDFEEGRIAEVHTNKETITYEITDNGMRKKDEKPHYFDEVPIVEYHNNPYRKGDFEDVIPLIDAYDNAQSDTSNYMSDLNDALLIMKGNMKFDERALKKMKDNNTLLLMPKEYKDENGKTVEGDVDAKYIYKQMDVTGSESYKKRVIEDIHTFSKVPNLQDESFGGTQSGESLKYKMIGAQQSFGEKVTHFERGLNKRYRLVFRLEKLASNTDKDFKVDNITYTFTENFPRMTKEEVENFVKVSPFVSQRTALELLSFVESPQEEIEALERERDNYSEVFELDEEEGEVVKEWEMKDDE